MKIIDSIKKDLNLTEVFRGGSVALTFKVAGIGMGYVFFLLISRIYGAEEQGIFSLCWTILMIGAVVGKIGLDTSIVRFIAAEIAKKNGSEATRVYRTGLALVLVCSIAVLLLLVIFNKSLSKLFFETSEKYYLINYAGLSVIPMAIMSYNAEALRGLKKIGWYSIFQNGAIYILILLILFLVYMVKPELNFLIPAMLFALLIMALISLLLFRSAENKVEIGQYHEISYPLKTILKVSFPMLLTNSLFLLMNWTDILMLGALKAETEVGIYTIAVKIAALNSVALVAVNSIAAPKFAELHTKNDLQGLRKIVKQTTLINTLLSLPVFLTILIFPRFLMKLFGVEFEAGVQALIILACGQFFNAFSGSTMYILNMTGKEITGRNILLAGTILNVLLNSLLIPRYGINGGAIATLSSTIVWNALAVIFIYKYYRFSTYPFNISGRHAD